MKAPYPYSELPAIEVLYEQVVLSGGKDSVALPYAVRYPNGRVELLKQAKSA